MPKYIFKRYHHYKLKKRFAKTSKFINDFIPLDDREVSKEMYEQYEDLNELRDDERGYYDKRKEGIFRRGQVERRTLC